MVAYMQERIQTFRCFPFSKKKPFLPCFQVWMWSRPQLHISYLILLKIAPPSTENGKSFTFFSFFALPLVLDCNTLACWLGPLWSLMNGVNSLVSFRREELRASPVALREGCQPLAVWRQHSTQLEEALILLPLTGTLRSRVLTINFPVPSNLCVFEFSH